MTVVSDITSRASELLNDLAQVRWTLPELVAAVNEAVKQIVILLPESNAVTKEIQLVEGTKQTVPADGVRLIDVMRNTGAAGSVPASPIRIIERDVLDSIRPTWHKDRTSLVAKNFVFDERNPKTFYVYPPSRGQYIEIIYSQMPAELTAADQLGVFDIYSAAILDYVLYRGFSKDTEEGSDVKAAGKYQQFLNGIGLFDQANQKALPNRYPAPRNKTSTGEAY